MIEKKLPLILVTNDDGVNAKGLSALIAAVAPFGRLVVVAPEQGQSGMSHAITVKYPLVIEKKQESEHLTVYSCNGTPVDCVKMAHSHLLDQKPDLLVSGINHGANSSASVIYSGTMAAAIEGAMYGVPAIGFSLLDFSKDADFSPCMNYIRHIVRNTMDNGLARGVCLNVNFPRVPENEFMGIRVCRQTKGYWKEEFDKRTDPHGRVYYWLTGEFHNLEHGVEDSDEWVLANNFVSIVPVHADLTAYHAIKDISGWDFSTLHIKQDVKV